MGLKKEYRYIVTQEIAEQGMDRCFDAEHCFHNDPSWGKIEDEKFHELRLAYMKASKEFVDYIYSKGEYAVGS